MLVEVEKDNVVDAVAAANKLLTPDGGVDERDFLVEHQCVRVHVEAEHRRYRADLFRAPRRHLQKLPMPCVDPVKEAQRDGSFCLCHADFYLLYLKKAFYRFHYAVLHSSEHQEFARFG